MTTHTAASVIAAPRETVFALVADVERYPEFLPMWKRARILSRHADGYETVQEIGLGPIRERFRTHTLLRSPEAIEVTSADGLFKAFRIGWTFAERGASAHVEIALNWEVRSRLLQAAIDRALPTTARSMIEAFERRATTLRPARPGAKR